MMAKKTKGLSERHRKILEFLAKHQSEKETPPTIREIGMATGISSTSVVNYYLDQLQEMGYITRNGGISRGTRLSDQAKQEPGIVQIIKSAASNLQNAFEDALRIPVLGRIVASAPIPVPSSDFNYLPEETIEIARTMLPGKDTNGLFALQVQGDSMIDAMVNDGDIVILKQTSDAKNGDMVAVWLPDRDETTLKYFFKESNRYRLQPANPTMEPIYIERNRPLEIRGKVIMVVRQFKQ